MNQIDRTQTRGAAEHGFTTRRKEVLKTSAKAASLMPETVPEAETLTSSKPNSGPNGPRRPMLTKEDVAALHAGLLRGDHALAQRRDLGELHRRTVEMFNMLKEDVIASKAADNSAQGEKLAVRLEQVSKSVDSIDGAIRIELAPMIQSMIRDVVAERLPVAKTKNRRGLWLALGLVCGIGIGTVFAAELSAAANLAVNEVAAAYAKVTGE